MPATPIIGRPVQIRGGMGEFAGRVGKIIAREGNWYRIRLLVPVNLADVGEVKEYLFDRSDFRLLTKGPRRPQPVRPGRRS